MPIDLNRNCVFESNELYTMNRKRNIRWWQKENGSQAQQ